MGAGCLFVSVTAVRVSRRQALRFFTALCFGVDTARPGGGLEVLHRECVWNDGQLLCVDFRRIYLYLRCARRFDFTAVF